jgi:hypothetical protein
MSTYSFNIQPGQYGKDKNIGTSSVMTFLISLKSIVSHCWPSHAAGIGLDKIKNEPKDLNLKADQVKLNLKPKSPIEVTNPKFCLSSQIHMLVKGISEAYKTVQCQLFCVKVFI